MDTNNNTVVMKAKNSNSQAGSDWFCPMCGKSNSAAYRFCIGCGSERPGSPAAELRPGSSADAINQKSEKRKSSIGKIIFFIATGMVLSLALLIVVAGLVASRKPKINLNDYLEFEVVDTSGGVKLSANMDWDSFEEDYGAKLRYNKEVQNTYFPYLYTPVQVVKNNVDVLLDKDYDLANGDVVSYTWRIGKKEMQYLDAEFTYEDGTYTVTKMRDSSTDKDAGGIRSQFKAYLEN